MRYILLLFIAFLSLANVSLAQRFDNIEYNASRKYEIAGVTVKGIKYLNEDILIKISGLAVGRIITVPGDDISTAIKKLWKQELFATVDIYATRFLGDQIFLEIVATERPRLSKFTFDGAKKSEIEDIRDDIKLLRGRVVTENLKIRSTNKIKQYYIEKGYINASVIVTEKPDSAMTNNVVLDFNIDKGHKARVNDVSFTGNDNFDHYRLQRLMKNTKEKTEINLFKDIRNKTVDLKTYNPKHITRITPLNLFNYARDNFRLRLFSASRYIKEDYKEDKEALIAFYNSKGYRDAYIISDSIYTNENHDLNIVINIDEGNQFYFRDIKWKGNTKYSSELLSKILGIKKGTIYDQTLLDERLFMSQTGGDVSSLYMDDGYLFFNITPVEIAVENDSIDLEIQVYEGPQAIINNVTIVGNTQTNERVIRRELRTLPGSKFSRSDIIRSQREIANLGFFDPEQLGVTPTPHPENGTVDIEYKVAEKPSSQAEMSLGWGGNGVVGTLGLSFNNFSTYNIFKKGTWNPLPSGDGQTFSIRYQANGRNFQSLNASFTEPWLGGKKPNSFTTSVYRSVNAFGDKDAIDYQKFAANGLTLSLGKRLKFPDDYFTLQSAINFQVYELQNWTRFIFSDGIANNISIQETLARTSIDQPLYPRTGSRISLSMQLTPSYSNWGLYTKGEDEGATDAQKYKWVEYHKWRFNAEWFTPLSKDNKLVLRTEAKFGFLGFYNSNVGLSPFERFELGGDGISNFNIFGRDIIALRGYEPNHVTPTNPVTGQIDGQPIFNKFTFELRYPLSLNPSSTIFTTAFVQAGNTYDNFSSYNPFKLKRSVGVGLRVFLPMFGLLGFDYGVGIDRNLPKPENFGDLLGRFGKFSIVLGFEPE